MTCDIVAIITIAKTVSGSIMNIMKSVVKGQIRSVNKSKSGWTMYTIVEKCMKCTCKCVSYACIDSEVSDVFYRLCCMDCRMSMT